MNVVRTGLIDHMHARIEAAPTPGAAIRTYLSSQLDYLAEHPQHVRVMAESFTDPDVGITEHADSQARWRPLADLIAQAQTAGEYDTRVDASIHAIMYGGAADALTAETLTSADFSLLKGAIALLGLIDAFTTSIPGTPALERRQPSPREQRNILPREKQNTKRRKSQARNRGAGFVMLSVYAPMYRVISKSGQVPGYLGLHPEVRMALAMPRVPMR